MPPDRAAFLGFRTQRTDAPNGISASLLNLKHCRPKGIPTTVTHSTSPSAPDRSARLQPKSSSHSTLAKKPHTDGPPYTISFPNGKSARRANLKHCSPSGMPMTVMQKSSPLKNQDTASASPASRNQRTFPRIRIGAYAFASR